MQDKQAIIDRIHVLKKEKNAVILAHNYCRGDVQDIADFVGDSLGLSRQAVEQSADIIVFCGVDFMAQSAAILSPLKKVLIPDRFARCPMAAMATADEVRKAKKQHPDAMVVSYVNSSAEVKAESDVCCTSANAVEVVNSLDCSKVLFIPDKNLGDYVAKNTDKEIILWDGYCPTHNHMLESDMHLSKISHADAEILAHPECRREILEKADHIFSTTGMTRHCTSSSSKKFIIATENGLLHRLRKDNPDKHFYPCSEYAICPDMKTIDPASVLACLENEEYEVRIEEKVTAQAKKALDRMLEAGRA